MSSTFRYDPLDILNKAEKSADDWWSNTLKNAKARTDLDQQQFKNAFENDKTMQTYGSDLFKTNAENVYKGTKASYDTLLQPDRYDAQRAVYGRDGLRAKDQSAQLQNAMSPENWAARVKVYDNNFQSPAAMLDANAASAGIADVGERNRIAGEVAQGYGGALSAQAVYGQGQGQANSLNLAGDISSGNLERANKALEGKGFGMKIVLGSTPGTVRIQHQDGTASGNMDLSAAASYVNDRTGGKPGQVQTAFDNEVRYNRTQQAADRRLDEARRDDELRSLQVQYQATAKDLGANSPQAMQIAERMNNLTAMRYSNGVQPPAGPPKVNFQQLMQTEEGLRLNKAFQDAAQKGDKAETEKAWLAIRDFKRAAVVEQNIKNGMDSSPYVSDQDLVMFGTPKPAEKKGLLDTVGNWFKGQPAPNRPYAPPANAAPAPAAPTAKASVYQPVDSAEPQLWKPGQAVDDDLMAKIEQVRTVAESKLNQVRSDWQRANSLQGRGAVTDQMRQRIKAALDAAQADADRANSQYAGAKREWDRARGDAAYSPSRALQQSRAASMDREFSTRYGQ